MEASKRKRSKAFMRKNLISILLAVILTAGSINSAAVCAAEITEQETVIAEESEAQEESAEEQAEDEESEKDEIAETDSTEDPKESSTEEIEEDSTEESEENSAEEITEDNSGEADETEDATTEQIEDPALIETEEPAKETEEAAIEASAAAAAAAETPDTEKTDDESLIDEVVVIEGVEEVVVPGGPSSDELFAEFVERSFEGQPLYKASKKLRSAVSVLQGNDRAVYNYIAGQLPQIAAGEQASTEFEITPAILGLENNAWTAEELGVDAVLLKDENGKAYIPADAQKKLAINLSRILDVLLAEHPYELYWYDKTSGAGTKITTFGLTAYYDRSRSAYVMSTTSNMYLRFCVAEEYSAGQYLVDTSIGQSVQSAVDNADAIVSEYSGLSDEEKLRAYKDEICVLVSYNSSATGGASYGNPWQMIWVFDGDTTTNVVCEGYAKAFKYLCDHTSFDGNIECILAGGNMAIGSRSEPHMWNILKMDDGKNYLVDVTNCDAGTSGYPDKLFLAGTARTKTDSDGNTGYYFADTGLTYYYDSDTRGIFSEEDLELFPHNYGEHEWGTEYIIDEEPTCTEDGSQSLHCTICDMINPDGIEVIPAIGHDYSDWSVTKEETCTEDGSKEKVCANCGDVVTEVIPAIGHNYSDWSVTKEETCTEDGSKEKVCANCGDVVTEAIPAIGHRMTRTAANEATCTENGNIEYWTCSECEKIFTDSAGNTAISLKETVTPAKGHKTTHTKAKEATCTENGNTEYWTCSTCGELFSDEAYERVISQKDTVISAKGHKWSGWTVTKEANCTESGSKERACSVCEVKETEIIPILTGSWLKDSTGWKFKYDDGTYPVNKFEKIDGKTYYFNEAGYRITGWKKIGNYWYYFNNDGTMHIGWRLVGSTWYYFNGDGHLLTGLQKVNGYWYYFNGNGARQTGWQKVGNYWYYFDSDGKMHVGWRKVGDIWYYFGGDGHLLTGLQKVNGYWYYFNGNGARQTGWQYLGSHWYYFNSDGKLHFGWKQIGSTWYYMDGNGVMVTGWQTINGVRYYFDASGAMQ